MGSTNSRQIGIELLIPVLTGLTVVSILVVSAGLDTKWLMFSVAGIFALSSAFVVSEREQFFLYSALFFCLFR
jgi:hypothetical protein